MEIGNLLKNWKNKGYIDLNLYKKLYVSDGELPRSYELPKIHKEGHPLRLIVSCINSAFYPLATFLKEIIDNNNIKNFSYVKNSFDLVNKLNGKVIDKNFSIISFDVVSMYTNIPTDLVLKSIERRWNLIENKTPIPLREFIKAVMIIINSTFFKFDKKIFKTDF